MPACISASEDLVFTINPSPTTDTGTSAAVNVPARNCEATSLIVFPANAPSVLNQGLAVT